MPYDTQVIKQLPCKTIYFPVALLILQHVSFICTLIRVMRKSWIVKQWSSSCPCWNQSVIVVLKKHLRMQTLSEGKSTFNSKKGGKKIPAKNCPITFFKMSYSPSFYEEILLCYDYETRNPTVYGNVIHSKMESSKSRKELWIDGKGNENHIQ